MDTLNDIQGIPCRVGDTVATDVMSYKSSSLRVGTIVELQYGSTAPWAKVSYEIPRRFGRKPTRNSVWRREGGFVRVQLPATQEANDPL